MARFRVLEPNQYDVDTPDVAEGATSKSIAKPGELVNELFEMHRGAVVLFCLFYHNLI